MVLGRLYTLVSSRLRPDDLSLTGVNSPDFSLYGKGEGWDVAASAQLGDGED